MAERVISKPENHVLHSKRAMRSKDYGDDVLHGKELSKQKPSSSLQSGVPSIVHQVLNSPSQALDLGYPTRTFMGPRFENDFSHVRVHMDSFIMSYPLYR